LGLFEFLMVLLSLIIGLGITELLNGVALSIRNKKTISLYWIHSLFVVIVFLALVQQWWEIWNLRDIQSWTFPGFLMMLGGPIGLYLIAHLLFPEPIEGLNFRTYYYEESLPILVLAILTVLVSSAFRPLVFGENIFSVDNLSSFALPVMFAAMAMTESLSLY
jgi:hypothetical protein